MRFPLSLTAALTGYLLKKRLSGQQRFPLALMLEPLHACNLSCAGCGRIREYADTLHLRMSIEECLDAVDECGAPVVSICGGEPLIYPEIGRLVREILALGKHVYLCTNGLNLNQRLPELPARGRLFLNVHLDGMEATHDRLAGRSGVFAAAVRGIQSARKAGFRVCTNTTFYRDTDIHEIAVLLGYLSELGVDGFLIAPAYGYEAVQEGDPAGAERIFPHATGGPRDVSPCAAAVGQVPAIRLAGLPGVPLRPARAGLRGLGQSHPQRPRLARPLLSDRRRPLPELRGVVGDDRLDALGPGGRSALRDCLMHCGFEPAAVLAANHRWRDALKMAVWQMG